jgi:hypothetical protein
MLPLALQLALWAVLPLLAAATPPANPDFKREPGRCAMRDSCGRKVRLFALSWLTSRTNPDLTTEHVRRRTALSRQRPRSACKSFTFASRGASTDVALTLPHTCSPCTSAPRYTRSSFIIYFDTLERRCHLPRNSRRHLRSRFPHHHLLHHGPA